MINNFVQFVLWHDCKNNCKFCHNKDFGDIDKNVSLNFVHDKLIDSNTFSNYNELGFIGGEFFDDQLAIPSINSKFYDVCDTVVKLLNEHTIDKFYITTALMYNDTKYLKQFCDYAIMKDIADKVLICTSYDTIGRFLQPCKLENWKNNMQFLHNEYPQLKVHTEIILTEDFMQKVLNGEFDISSFEREYATTIDYISPHIVDFLHKAPEKTSKQSYNAFIPGFFPKRSTFINFMKSQILRENKIALFKFLSNYIRADRLYTIANNQFYVIDNRRINDSAFCGLEKTLNISFIDGYIDSDIQMEKDARALYEIENR